MTGQPETVAGLTRAEVIEVLARMIRDEAYPEFGLAPPPEWAARAAAKVIDYHQPMLRDHLLAAARAEAFAEIRRGVEAIERFQPDDYGGMDPDEAGFWLQRRRVMALLPSVPPELKP